MPRLTVNFLPDDQVGEAYPLIRAATKIGPRRWAAYVRLLRHESGNVLAVTDNTGRIYGVAAFRPGGTLRHPRSLIVDAIAAFELGREPSVKAELCRALRKEARSRGCGTILVHAAAPRDDQDHVPTGWEKMGWSVETITVMQEISLEVASDDA